MKELGIYTSTWKHVENIMSSGKSYRMVSAVQYYFFEFRNMKAIGYIVFHIHS